MALNRVSIDGDVSHLEVLLENITAGQPELISRAGSFRGTADELRTFSLFLETDEAPLKSFELRITVYDPRFAEVDMTGQARPIFMRAPSEER